MKQLNLSQMSHLVNILLEILSTSIFQEQTLYNAGCVINYGAEQLGI